MEGTMLWFNPDNRHGFIHTDEGERFAIVPLIAARRARLRGRR